MKNELMNGTGISTGQWKRDHNLPLIQAAIRNAAERQEKVETDAEKMMRLHAEQLKSR